MASNASRSAFGAISRAGPSAISLSPTAAILRRWSENGTLRGHLRHALTKASKADAEPATDPDVPSQNSLRVLDPSPQVSLDDIQQYLGRGRVAGGVWKKNFSRAIAKNASSAKGPSSEFDDTPSEAGPLWKQEYKAVTDLHKPLSPLQSLMREYSVDTPAPESKTAGTTGTVVPPPTPMDLETLATKLEAQVQQHLREEVEEDE